MDYQVSVDIRFRDVDALGHVNNAVFLSYCELTRQRYFQEHFGVRQASDFAFILARAELDYLAPLGMEENTVTVNLSVPRIGNSSWDFAYDVARADGTRSFARAKTVQVYYDYAASSKAPLPESYRQKLEALRKA